MKQLISHGFLRVTIGNSHIMKVTEMNQITNCKSFSLFPRRLSIRRVASRRSRSLKFWKRWIIKMNFVILYYLQKNREIIICLWWCDSTSSENFSFHVKRIIRSTREYYYYRLLLFLLLLGLLGDLSWDFVKIRSRNGNTAVQECIHLMYNLHCSRFAKSFFLFLVSLL